MKRKKNFYDIVAACAFVFNVDWDEEYELLEVEDIFWDNADWQKNELTDLSDVSSSKMQVS
ncbi:MAG: hypothetical protein FWG21_05500 [Oscillospiraceae bacterium]|nr:hypothetical protein [Oscillospiraceae bacterium]